MTLLIEMVSDLVCPWCWVGLRRLKAASALVPDVPLELAFRPYELDPSVPPEGVDYKEYMQKRFGSDTGKQRANTMRDALIQYGVEENIPFAFDRITRRPNSFDAHRVVFWAQGQGKGIEAKEALFEAYFSLGKDISDHQVLVEIAGAIDLDPEIVSDLLATKADVDTVRGEQDLFRQMGISGVPTYIAHRKIAVQGAESPERLAEFLKSAHQQMPTERPLGANS